MIPAFNEEETVGFVVRDVPRRIEGIDVVQVLLVDDGSTDSTIPIRIRFPRSQAAFPGATATGLGT